jgi:uncharacterized damage-inducible protein DinB
MSNSEQATAVAAAMASIWQGELPATVRVISAVPDDRRDYRPDPRSRSAWDLVTHIAVADVWFIDSIERGVFEFDADAAERAAAQFASVSEVAAFYEAKVPARLARLQRMSGDDLAAPVDFFGMITLSRAAWIGFANNHSVHHRGQLSTYLRAMGAKVPDIYGPSGDAEPVPAPPA